MKSTLSEFQRRVSPQVEEQDSSWFEEQLSKGCPEYYPRGNDFLILCPSPNHSDTSVGSCGVNRHTGSFYCFSCKFGGPWNYLASLRGMEQLSSGDTDPTQIKESISRVLSKGGVVDPVTMTAPDRANRPLVTPWKACDEWRDIPGEFLNNMGCVKVVNLKNMVTRIGLPVRDAEGDLLGYTCRATYPEDATPRYLPLAADGVTWRKKELSSKESLYLIENVLELGLKYVVLVEGPYDALRLWYHGIPAVAILGTGNWHEIKVGILLGLGLERVFSLMDNDDAGRDCQSNVISDLTGQIPVTGLKLPAYAKDPGKLKVKSIVKLKAYLDSFDL